MSLHRAAAQRKKQHWRRRWYGVCVFLCAIAVFVTTYALILPALTEETAVYCGLEEHRHEELCYQVEYICGLEGVAEAHSHSEACMATESVLVCPLSEEGHFHNPSCYAQEQVLACPLEENEEHAHSEECFVPSTELLCALPASEGHVHTEDCYECRTVYVCGLAESHSHTDVCYREWQALCCFLEEDEGHEHGEECYEITVECTCELEATHIHDASCVQLVPCCALEEHTHGAACYSNPSADVEVAEVWERTLPTLTGDRIADLMAIADSQLGYGESERNYLVTESGAIKGYSRYGQWYGDAYGDWCAMFAAFCLRYAGFDAVPIHSNCQRWVEALTEDGLYMPAGVYVPGHGDVIFFDLDGDVTADHVGLVVEVDDGILTIEGNSGDAVRSRRYNLNDGSIMGYAMLSRMEGVPPKKALEGNYQEIGTRSDFTNRVEDTTTTHIRLTANIEITSGYTLKTNKNLTIDLNGYVLSYKGTSAAMFTVGSGRTLTIWDSQQPMETVTMEEYDPANRKEYPATLSGKTLDYYVMTTEVVDPVLGATREEVQKHTFTAAGGIQAAITKTTTSTSIVNLALVYVTGGTFNLEGGMLYGVNFDGYLYETRAISMTSGTVNLNGGYICGFDRKFSGTLNAATQFGGAVYMTGGTANVMGSVLAANTAGSAGAIYASGGTVNVGSNGEEVGIIAGNQALSGREAGSGKGYNGGGGIYIKNATLNMTAGYITNNIVVNYTEPDNRDQYGGYYSGGGGVFMEGSSKMDFCGGYITGNWADGGGGIRTSLEHTNYLTMYCLMDEELNVISAPFVTANTVRAAEGGGISLGMGTSSQNTGATITGGYVTNNVILATLHWGGGGLFCAENAVLHLENALVTENTAGGLGGGMAGCSTGHIFVHTSQGCAVYDNEDIIHGDIQYASSEKPDNELIEKHPAFLNHGHSDYFCALESEMSGEMMGGGVANWEGTADGKAITIGRYDIAPAKELMGLKSHPTEEDKLAAQEAAQLYINGNHSFTHGGGIMCNGIMSVGMVEPMYVPVSFDPDAVKKLIDSAGNEIPMDDYKFQFAITDILGNEISHGTTDKTGHIVFDKPLVLREVGTETFYIKELRDEDHPNILTDTTLYRLQTTVAKGTETSLDDGSSKVMLKLTGFVLDKLNAQGEWETAYSESGKSYIGSIQLRVFGDMPAFTNVLVENTDIQVQKVWKDNNSQAVTVHLYRDDVLVDTQVLNSQNSWKYTWSDMPMGDGTRKYEYRVEEDPVAGYVTEYFSGFGSGGTYWVPATSLTLGKEYLITNSGGNYALMLTSGHANANLTSNDRTSVTSKSGTLSVGGGTYSTWYEGEMASDRVFVAEATSNASYLTLKNKARDSWLAATVSSSWFSKTYNLRGYTTKSSASAFFLNNGVLQSSEGNNWSGNTRYNVVYSDNKFTASTGTSNAVKLYERVSLPGSLVFTIVNTPVASTKYEIHLEKVSGKDGSALVGAEFRLLNSSGTALTFTTSGNGVYTLSTASGSVNKLVTSTGGRMVITGLSAGEYILQETVAPLGHMPIDDYHLTLGEGSQGTTISLRLVDPIFAYTLPETGGSGTTMYIVVGFALVLTGGFLLYCKRRREAVENL